MLTHKRKHTNNSHTKHSLTLLAGIHSPILWQRKTTDVRLRGPTDNRNIGKLNQRGLTRSTALKLRAIFITATRGHCVAIVVAAAAAAVVVVVVVVGSMFLHRLADLSLQILNWQLV